MLASRRTACNCAVSRKKMLKTLLILVCIASTLHAQERYSTSIIEEKLKWKRDVNILDQSYLPEYYIPDSSQFYYYKIRTSNQLIELFGKESQEFEGRIYNIIIEQKKGPRKTGSQLFHYKYIYECVKIESGLASQIGRFLIKNNLQKLSTDSNIKGWEIRYENGPSLRLYIKQGERTWELQYRMPWSQPDSNQYAKKILGLEESLESRLDLKNLFIAFEQNLDKGKWYTFGDELSGSIYFLRPWESWRRKRQQPRILWLRKNSNSVQEYLEKEIREKINKDTHLPEAFVFTLNRRGKIVNIKPLLPIAPWKRLNYPEFNAGIKELKSVSKKIAVKTPIIEYPIKLTIYINDGEVSISDF